MVSKNDNKYVIYPLYFDSSISRLKGRKVAKKYAVEKPTVERIAKAAQSLRLKQTIESDSFHPSTPWKKNGRILIEKKVKKSKLLKELANRL